MKYIYYIVVIIFLSSCYSSNDNSTLKNNNISPLSNSLVQNIYQIWVGSYYDTNDDGIGDIKGIIDNLKYLKSLNIDTILLSPISRAPSYHGYDVTNHMEIDPKYGSMNDFEILISNAHDIGIKVIIDLPINHTSDQHHWFDKPDYYLPPVSGLLSPQLI